MVGSTPMRDAVLTPKTLCDTGNEPLMACLKTKSQLQLLQMTPRTINHYSFRLILQISIMITCQPVIKHNYHCSTIRYVMLCLTQTSTGFTNSSLQASPLEALQHSKNCSKESSKPAQAQVPMADAQLGCGKCTQFRGSWWFQSTGKRWTTYWTIWKTYAKPLENILGRKHEKHTEIIPRVGNHTYVTHVETTNSYSSGFQHY